MMYPKPKSKKKRMRHPQSIMQDKASRTCYLCEKEGDYRMHLILEEHHVIHGTAGRRKAEEYGLKVYLCPAHHRTGPNRVHDNNKSNKTDLILKADAQRAFEKLYSHEMWMQEIGSNYLEEQRWN